MVHDIGLYLVSNNKGEVGFNVFVGGGLGRTPHIGKCIRDFLEKKYLLSYIEAILRVYNRFGRRDNIYKARIKILVNEIGPEEFGRQVEAEWEHIKEGILKLEQKELDYAKSFFISPDYDNDAVDDDSFNEIKNSNDTFSNWTKRNLYPHKISGYHAVIISLKAPDIAPGDATDKQMDAIADLSDQYSCSEIIVTHDQNLVLPHVKQSELFSLWQALSVQNLATPNIGLLTDMICCPGLDFCSLANAGSIPIAKQINEKFDDMDYLHDIGDLKIKMSGCMNACGHHHVGHIGILGVDKKGEEFYQLTLGGSSENDASLGDRLGPAIAKTEVANVIGKLLDVYIQLRKEDERFLETYRRVGIKPFKENVYASN
jgi:sulfite reductase (NADPH) hemoprotein beta-component